LIGRYGIKNKKSYSHQQCSEKYWQQELSARRRARALPVFQPAPRRSYWSLGKHLLRPEVFAHQTSNDICPRRGPNYQLMGNFLFAASIAERDGRAHFGVLTIGPRRLAPALPNRSLPSVGTTSRMRLRPRSSRPIIARPPSLMHSQTTKSLFANILNADFCNTIGQFRTLQMHGILALGAIKTLTRSDYRAKASIIRFCTNCVAKRMSCKIE
jgi:hypothetical protein